MTSTDDRIQNKATWVMGITTHALEDGVNRRGEGGLEAGEMVGQDFFALFPEKFQNKTNGVTPRRWLAFANPELAALITQTLGSDNWIKHTDELVGLRKYADDRDFHAKWIAIKRDNKVKLAAKVKVCAATAALYRPLPALPSSSFVTRL